MTRAAACHRFHTTLQRLCLWLLTVSDSLQSETVEVTQDLLAQFLGTTRTGISLAATTLSDEGRHSSAVGPRADCAAHGIVRAGVRLLRATCQAARSSRPLTLSDTAGCPANVTRTIVQPTSIGAAQSS